MRICASSNAVMIDNNPKALTNSRTPRNDNDTHNNGSAAFVAAGRDRKSQTFVLYNAYKITITC